MHTTFTKKGNYQNTELQGKCKIKSQLLKQIQRNKEKYLVYFFRFIHMLAVFTLSFGHYK